MRTILIEIRLSGQLQKSDLELRHFLVNKIENLYLGEVVEETSSPDILEIVVETQHEKKIENDLKILLQSNGLENFTIQEILID